MARYIDAETVIQLITSRYECPEICTAEINAIPTADVAPVVHAHWKHDINSCVINEFNCSACGHEEISLIPINPIGNYTNKVDENGNFYKTPKINYCPNCGALMDKED